jgi:hypothetical protein
MAAIKYIDMYKDFLTIVRKSRVGTVEPKEFTSFINLAQEEIVSQMLEVMDLNKKFMNNLLPLRNTSVQLDITLDSALSTRYRTGVCTTPTDCRRIARITVIISSTVIAKTNLIKSNEVSEIVDGVFSKPTSKNCYYHLERDSTTDKVRLFVPNMIYGSTPIEYPKCILEYYTTPTAITEVNVVSSSETCVFNKEVCTEIVNIAARMYLESVQDARYQTFNNELKQKN